MVMVRVRVRVRDEGGGARAAYACGLMDDDVGRDRET